MVTVQLKASRKVTDELQELRADDKLIRSDAESTAAANHAAHTGKHQVYKRVKDVDVSCRP